MFSFPVPIPASSLRICNVLMADSGHVCTVLILAEVSKQYNKTNNEEQ